MKKLLILPLLMLLTGCVTYYYPETAYEDGVYYAEDDPSYAVYADSYAGAAYYPWSSIDFFYTGYYPYSGFTLGWGYYSGFSFGVGYTYSPWHYPYNSYGYYYPYYRHHHHYAYYPYTRPYRGYCSGHYNCGKKKNHHGGGKHDRYAGNGGRDRDNRNNRNDRYDDYDDNRHKKSNNNEPYVGRSRNTSVRRYVSTAPSGNSSNRGMVIRNNESTKISKSQLEPDKTTPVWSANASPSISRTAPVKYDTSGLGNNVRYRSDAKQSRSKTGPVSSGLTQGGVNIVSAPSGNKSLAAPVSRGNSPTLGTVKRSETPQRPPSRMQPSKSSKSTSSNSKQSRSRPAPSSTSSKRVSKSSQSSRRQRRE